MAAVLGWLAPRSAAVRSLRLRASDQSRETELTSPLSWAQFVPLLNNISNVHDRQLVARKMQPLLMAAWSEREYPSVEHDYTRYGGSLLDAQLNSCHVGVLYIATTSSTLLADNSL